MMFAHAACDLHLFLRGFKYILAFILVFVGFAKAQTMDYSALKGRWVLEAIDGKSAGFERGDIYLEITEQAISGYDGCNRFAGSLAQPSRIQKTQRGCPPDATLLPLDLSNPASQLTRATIRDDKLILPLPEGKEARFRRSQ